AEVDRRELAVTAGRGERADHQPHPRQERPAGARAPYEQVLALGVVGDPIGGIAARAGWTEGARSGRGDTQGLADRDGPRGGDEPVEDRRPGPSPDARAEVGPDALALVGGSAGGHLAAQAVWPAPPLEDDAAAVLGTKRSPPPSSAPATSSERKGCVRS